MTRHPRVRFAATLLAAACLAACGGQEAAPPVPAFTVIGQSTFQGEQANQGGAVAANTLDTPVGNVEVAQGGTLFVPDTHNNRVLAYRQIPDTNNVPADFVLGAEHLDLPGNAGTSRTSMLTPLSVSTALGKMAIADASNNRVLIYASIPTSSAAPADVVVGQPEFGIRTSRGCTQAGLRGPHAATLTSNGKLVVVDQDHHRVLIWNSVPQTDGQLADAVLGQPDFDQCNANNGSAPTESTMNNPSGLWSDGRRLIVADSTNNRVLIWNQMPAGSSENFKPADVVLGQSSMSGATRNDADGDGIQDAAPSSRSIAFPAEVHSDGMRLAVTDVGNNRVLIWNSIPTRSGTAPDRVIGQADFTHGAPNDVNQDGTEDELPSEAVFNNPRGVFFHGKRLFVSEARNHRVMIIRLD